VLFDALLLDKSLATKVLNVAFHLRAATPITEPREIIGWDDSKLA